MLDLPSFDEWLVIAVVAIVVIGPKDLPMALRTLGQWVAKVRRVSGHFRMGVENMIREAELEEMEKKWKAQNAAIMASTAGAEGALADAGAPSPASKADAMTQQAQGPAQGQAQSQSDPQLPL